MKILYRRFAQVQCTKQPLVLIACIGLCGCSGFIQRVREQAERNRQEQNEQAERYRQEQYDATYENIEIISNPPGSKIEIDNEYVGDTPITATVDRTTGMQGYKRNMVIRANPINAGECLQTKEIVGYKTPSKIYFELGLCPIPSTVNVNVNR